MLYITKSRNLEAVTVTFLLGFLITSVVFYSKFEASVCKIMLAKTHELV